MKHLFEEILDTLLGGVLMTGFILGGFYIIGWIVELMVTNLHPAVICFLCIVFVVLIVNAVYDNKI